MAAVGEYEIGEEVREVFYGGGENRRARESAGTAAYDRADFADQTEIKYEREEGREC